MNNLSEHTASDSFRTKFREYIRENKISRWAYRFLKIMVIVAIFGNFIANERPIICKIDGQIYFPALKQYSVDLGLGHWGKQFVMKSWKNQTYDWVIFPPVPYSYNTLDIANSNYKSPFEKQKVSSLRYHHWLGTDQLGRDVFAGMVSGTRTALLVGVLAMGVAGFIGVLFGLFAGYYGNNGFVTTYPKLFFVVIGAALGFFYGFPARAYAFQNGAFLPNLLLGLGIFVGVVLVFWMIARLFERNTFFSKEIKIPIDSIVLRIIEVLNSIPNILLIISIVALFKKNSLFNLMVIFGLISWTSIARFVRAELMKVRQMEYIQAARALGYNEWRIMWKHALPNALGPVVISLSFGVAGAIMAEATLSFLGIGVPEDLVTWGSMLNDSREVKYAWWLAVFPGFAIFLTVTLFNLLGENIEKVMKGESSA